MATARAGPLSGLTTSASHPPNSEEQVAQRSTLPIRSSRDYDNISDEDDDIPIYTTPQSSRTHRASPSTSRLLESEAIPGSPTTAEARRQNDLRRAYELGEDGRGEYGASGGLRGARDKLKGFLSRNNGFILIGLAQCFFASISTCVKLLQEQVDMPVWEIILIRMSATWLGCYIYMRWTNVEHALLGPPGVRLLLAARGFVGFFGLAPGYYALKYLSLSDATVLSFLAPVLVGILAFLLLGESYSRIEALAGLFSLFGVVLIAKPTFIFPVSVPEILDPTKHLVTPEERTMAVGIALCGTLGAAGAYVIIRKIGKRANALHSISYFSAYCCLVSTLYPFFIHSPPVFHFTRNFILLILPIGIFGFCAQALLTLGLQREKAGRGTLAVYSNLLFAMILERLVFHKYPDLLSLLGACIIVGGAVKVALEKSKLSGDGSVGTGGSGGGGKSVEAKAEEGELLRRLSEEEDEEDEAGRIGRRGSRGAA